jgi:hypothetical protein
MRHCLLLRDPGLLLGHPKPLPYEADSQDLLVALAMAAYVAVQSGYSFILPSRWMEFAAKLVRHAKNVGSRNAP